VKTILTCSNITNLLLFFLKVCDGKEYAVHRVILAARSQVFRAMFARQDKVEGLPARAVVEDIRPHVLVRIRQSSTERFTELYKLNLLPVAY
jgi:hypothetical protein